MASTGCRRKTHRSSLACIPIAGILAIGCGSSTGAQKVPTPSTGATAGASQPAAQAGQSAAQASSQGPGALSADARSAATGDIPDTQVFLEFTDRAAGFMIKYPEGWTRSGSPRDVTFRDKNNLMRVVIADGSPPTSASVTSRLEALKATDATLSFQPPRWIRLPVGPAVKVLYTTQSAPDPVTGRRVKLVVDRYVFGRSGRVATVDLGTPVGVDNADAYRMIINSFRWL